MIKEDNFKINVYKNGLKIIIFQFIQHIMKTSQLEGL